MKRKNNNRWIMVLALSMVLLFSQDHYPVMAQEAGSMTEQEQNSDGADNSQTGTTGQPGLNEPATEAKQDPADAAQNPGDTSGNTPQNPTEDTGTVIIPEMPEAEPPAHAPKVVVSGCTTDVEQIEPGMDVTFTVSLKNTSSDVAVYNMKVSYENTTGGGDMTPLEATNSRYIASLGAGAGTSISFSMHVSRDILNYSQKLTINMEYENEDAMTYSSSESVFVNIYRPLGFVTDKPIVPSEVVSKETANISVNLFNTGKATIYNVYCKIKCRGFLESGTYYVGNILPESSATANLAPIASNRNYGGLGDASIDKYGNVSGKIIITYEDETGTEYTKELEMSTTIVPPPDEVEEPELEEITYSSQWWVSIVALLAALDALVIFLAYYLRKHRV